MKGEDLFCGLRYVNPEYVKEAETATCLKAERNCRFLLLPVLTALQRLPCRLCRPAGQVPPGEKGQKREK